MEQGASVEAIVLAAGASVRLGRPKALLDFDGDPALLLVLHVLGEVGVPAGVIVTGDEAGPVRATLDPTPYRFVQNPAPQHGRTGSLQVGLAETDAGSDVLFWPVDRPMASLCTVRALLDALSAGEKGEGVVVPESGGRRGHPVILRAELRPALLAARPDESLREVIRASGLSRREVSVNDAGIHANLDTEDAYRSALEQWRSRNRR